MKIRRFTALLLAVLMAVSCAACGGETPQESTPGTSTAPGNVTYSVTVTDGLGNPWSGGVIVNFMKDGVLAAMQSLDSNGVASKELPAGDYTAELAFTSDADRYHYDASVLALTADQPSATVVLANKLGDDSITLGVGGGEYTAYALSMGCTYVELSDPDRNYFIFTPVYSGTYEFSIIGGTAVIGYYGSPYFVQDINLGVGKDDGSFTVSVSQSMIGTEGTGTTVMVLGVDANGSSDCIVSIQRVGEAEKTIADYEWTIYSGTVTPAPYILPEGTVVHDFDITAATDAYVLVYNDADGCYHLNTADGPLVFCKLGVESDYLDPIVTILESSGITSYYFDDQGNFVEKVSFTECLNGYVECMDTVSGLYPLTHDLMYIINERGTFSGWWEEGNPGYIFTDDNGNSIIGLNKEIAWLFLCCYAEVEVEPEPTEPQPTEPEPTEPQPTEPEPTETEPKPTQTQPTEPEPTEPEEVIQQVVGTLVNADDPIVLGGAQALDFNVDLEPGTYMYYQLYKISGTTLKITADAAYVICGGVTYWPENGVISIPLSSDGPSVPVEIYFGNCSNLDKSFSVQLSYPLGTQSNPETCRLGTLTAAVEQGNDQGYYFTYVADKSGVLTLTLESISIDYDCYLTLYNLDTYAYHSSTEGTISIEVNAGDTVQITVGVSDPAYKYPAATIVVQATLE